MVCVVSDSPLQPLSTCHVWDLRRRTHAQAIDLGKQHQLVLELRPSHDPTRTYGFVGVVASLEDLSSSIWLWHRASGKWEVCKVISIPAEPAGEKRSASAAQGLQSSAALVTDINLLLDDRFLYVSCWGKGELQQYDVSDPFNPKLTGSVRIGGIVKRTPHSRVPLSDGLQMVDVSRDGTRVYLTNRYTALGTNNSTRTALRAGW